MKLLKRIYISSLVFPMMLLGACSQDLEKAAKIGDQLEILQKAGAEIASGLYISCLNTRQLSLDSGYLKDKRERVETAQEKCGKRETVEQSTGALNFSFDVGNSLVVLNSYISGLTTLADAKGVNFQEPTQKLFESIGNLNTSFQETDAEGNVTKPISDEAITAGQQIFSVIVDFFQRNYRRREVKLAIVCTNQPFEDFSKGLIDLVQLSYIDGVLETEETALDLTYGSVEPEKDTPSIPALILRNFQDDDFEDLENRRKRAFAFQNALTTTVSTHSALEEEFRPDIKATPEELEETCQEYLTKEEKPEENEPVSELEIEDFDIEQLQRLQVILLTYQEQMEPIIEQLNE